MNLVKLLTLLMVMTLLACQKSSLVSDEGGNLYVDEKKENSVLNSNPPKIGVQLWSVRDALKEDFKGTLEQIADMGFDGVEFAGNFGPYKNDGQGLNEYLKSIGLAASAAHVKFREFDEQSFKKSVEFYRAAGIKTLIIAWDDRAWDPDRVDELVQQLNQVAKNLRSEGLQFGYHNHDKEFNTYGNGTFWDHIARSTPEDFVLQIDIGWVTYVEKDPVKYIQRYSGRTQTTHLKATLPKTVKHGNGKRPIIGDDVADWASILKAGVSSGGTEWFVVEQEEYPDGLSPMEAVRQSKIGLDKIIKQIELAQK